MNETCQAYMLRIEIEDWLSHKKYVYSEVIKREFEAEFRNEKGVLGNTEITFHVVARVFE